MDRRRRTRELLEIAVEVARDAAETAYRMRAEGVSAAATKSTVTDVVTAADRAVERQVLDALRRAAPGRRGARRGVRRRERRRGRAGGVRWIVDPIDGTVNYLYGLPHCAVSLAAEVDGVVVAGVVRNVAPARSGPPPRAAAPGATVRGCAAPPRPTWGRRWSPPASATTPAAGRTRPGWSPG